MSARSLFVMEVESSLRWTIRKVGQGVVELLGEATRESILGKSLATLVRCHDVKQLSNIWPSTETHGVASLSPNYLINSILFKFRPDDGGSPHYMGVFFRVIPLKSGATRMQQCDRALARNAEVDRVLLVGTLSTPKVVGACPICGLACCAPSPEAIRPLPVPLSVPRPLGRPQQLDFFARSHPFAQASRQEVAPRYVRPMHIQTRLHPGLAHETALLDQCRCAETLVGPRPASCARGP